MPFALRRPRADNPAIKEWRSHDPDGDGYWEIIKYKTRERAQLAAASWKGKTAIEIVEVKWTAGDSDETYPDY